MADQVLLTEEEKKSNVTLAELEKELYQYPPGTHDFINIRNQIVEMLQSGDDKYKKYLIGVPSALNEEYHKQPKGYPGNPTVWETINTVSGKNGVFEIVNSNDEKVCLFSDELSFPQDINFKYPPRWAVEFNPGFKQLVVGIYITDGRDIVLLKTHKNATRISDKYTMIQGHVEFDSSAYLKTQTEYLREQAIRELEEETNVREDSMQDAFPTGLIGDFEMHKIGFPETPRFYANMRSNHIDIEHFGILYEIRVHSIKGSFPELASGESHTHDVVVVNMREALYNPDINLDNWVRSLIETIIETDSKN